MRTIIIFTLLFLVSGYIAVAQNDVTHFEENEKHPRYNAAIKFDLFNSLINEIPLLFELKTSQITALEFKVGYIHKNKEIVKFISSTSIPYFAYHRGMTAGIRLKRFTEYKHNHYFATSLSYYYKNADNENLWKDYGNEYYRIELNQTLHQMNAYLAYGMFLSNHLIFQDLSVSIGLGCTKADTEYLYRGVGLGGGIPDWYIEDYIESNVLETYYEWGWYLAPVIKIEYKVGLWLKKKNNTNQ